MGRFVLLATLPIQVRWHFAHTLLTHSDPLGEGQKLRMGDIAFLALDKHAILRGVVVGSREQFEEMNALISLKKIRPVVDKVFAFERTREAYEALWTAGHVGKIVIEIARPE
jgi:NADPH:quinone reductase-like Zn-dependent oxidoreductase